MENKYKSEDFYTDSNEFFLRGNTTGILLLHSASCTPAEARGLGDYLSKEKYTIYAPKLDGHGANYKDLLNYDMSHWANQVANAVIKLRKDCDKIFLVGNSMGSLLALNYSLKSEVNGVVAISPPIINPVLLPVLQTLGIFIKDFAVDKNSKKDIEINLKNHPPYTALYYPRQNMSTLIDILKLSRNIQSNINKLTSPILIIQGAKDQFLPKDSADKLKLEIKNMDSELLRFPNSLHDVLVGEEREEVWKSIKDFIVKNS